MNDFERFTIVFDGDLRKIEGNPLKIGSAFGSPHAVGFGDAFAERDRMEDRIDELEQALHKIRQWADAYPLDIFPEPDFKKVRELLEAGGITLDSVSASNMRHVVKGVGEIARTALKAGDAG